MTVQSKQSLEEWYKDPDPWGYETNPDDIARKQKILDILAEHGPYFRALDIGCGEGWITKDLPSPEIHGIERSDAAAERLPDNVTRLHEPYGTYDLIVCTGVLYKQYDWRQITEWIKNSARGIVLTSNIKSWEINELPADKQIFETEFPYRDYIQKLRVYKW